MQLIDRGLRARGVSTAMRDVPLAEIASFRSAFLTNCGCPVRPVAAIDGVELEVDDALMQTLEACHASNPLQPI
jgi:hypothetical protein